MVIHSLDGWALTELCDLRLAGLLCSHQPELHGSLATCPSGLSGSLRTELHGPFGSELHGSLAPWPSGLSLRTELDGPFKTELHGSLELRYKALLKLGYKALWN